MLADEHEQAITSEDLVDLDDDSVVQPAKPLPDPKVPTAAEIDAHMLTH